MKLVFINQMALFGDDLIRIPQYKNSFSKQF